MSPIENLIKFCCSGKAEGGAWRGAGQAAEEEN